MKTNKPNATLARQIFNPAQLVKYLIRDTNGIAYVDRSKILVSKPGYMVEMLYSITLHHDYGWDFNDFQESTIYLEVGREVKSIHGGVYSIRDKIKLTRKLIASPSNQDDDICDHYLYTPDLFDTLCTTINKA
jgi:hypothetical protein